MWEGAQSFHTLRASLPLNFCMLINLESFQTPAFWVFLEALLFLLCLVRVVSDFYDLMDYIDHQAPLSMRFSINKIQARILEWVAIFFSRDLPDPGI